MNKLLTGESLKQRAKELGVSTEGELIVQSANGRRSADEATLQRRLCDAETHIRQNKLWIIAVISAVSAVVSAIGSLMSILWNLP